MPKILNTDSAWIPAVASILAVAIAGWIQYNLTQATIKSQSQAGRISNLVAEYFEGAANPDAEQGRWRVATAKSKAAIYGNREVVEAFARLERALADKDENKTQAAMVQVVMTIRRQAELPEASRADIAVLVGLR